MNSPINIYDRITNLKHLDNMKLKYWLEDHSKLEENEAALKQRDFSSKYGMQTTQSDVKGQSSFENAESKEYSNLRGIQKHEEEKFNKIQSDNQAMDEIMKKSDRLVASVSTVFPFTLFPDTIEIEESRVVLVFRQFLTSQSHSVDIKDIANVFIQNAFFFSTIEMISSTFTQNDVKIGYLKKKDAIYARKIIEGLRLFSQKGIDTSRYEIPELVKKLEEVSIQR